MLQTLAALAAGLGCSVYLLLACLALAPQLAVFEREFLLDQRSGSPLLAPCLMHSTCSTLLNFYFMLSFSRFLLATCLMY